MGQIFDDDFESMFGMNEEKAIITLEKINNILDSASAETTDPDKRFVVQLSLLAEAINEICLKNGKDPTAVMLQLFTITCEMKNEDKKGEFGLCF